MSFPEPPHLRRQRQRNPQTLHINDLMKLPLTTLIGAALAVASKLIGAEAGELQSVWQQALALWPLLVGLLADAGSVWTTLKATRINKTLFTQRTFWLQLVSGTMVIISAFGIDITGLEALQTKILQSTEAITALIGSALILIGRWRLKQAAK